MPHCEAFHWVCPPFDKKGHVAYSSTFVELYCVPGIARHDPVDHEILANVLKALSDPTRLRIFALLTEGTHCNCEVAEQFGLSLSLVSHHLRVLVGAGLVEGRRASEDARWIYYSVNEEALARLGQDLASLLDAGRIGLRTPACGPRSRSG